MDITFQTISVGHVQLLIVKYVIIFHAQCVKMDIISLQHLVIHTANHALNNIVMNVNPLESVSTACQHTILMALNALVALITIVIHVPLMVFVKLVRKDTICPMMGNLNAFPAQVMDAVHALLQQTALTA